MNYILNYSIDSKISTMKVGDRVRVIKSVIVYHHPQHKNQPFDVLGMEGEIIRIVNQWQGRPISANLPYLVQFDKKFKAHFRADEIAIIDSEK